MFRLLLLFLILNSSKQLFAIEKKIDKVAQEDLFQFLSSFDTLQADFEQQSFFGTNTTPEDVQRGYIVIKRPSKIAIDYKSKNNDAKLVIDKSSVKFLDRKSNQLTNLSNPKKDMFLLFASKDYSLFKFYNIEKDNNRIKACFLEKDSDSLCDNCLYLKKDNNSTNFGYSVEKIVVIRYEEGAKLEPSVRIEILFSSIVYDSKINNDIFIIKDPRIFNDEF
jgi:outer membrane lipoprotein-sorting protein